jgi:hypothetical protein
MLQCFFISIIVYKHALVVHAARYAEKLKLAHNLKVGGSNPPRSNIKDLRDSLLPLEARPACAQSAHSKQERAKNCARLRGPLAECGLVGAAVQ